MESISGRILSVAFRECAFGTTACTSTTFPVFQNRPPRQIAVRRTGPSSTYPCLKAFRKGSVHVLA